MATLRDVAKLANVDVSTVSRALNNSGLVHPDTKTRIYAAVEELSYKPNILAQGLRQGKRHTIGVVMPSLHLSIFAEVMQGIERQAQRLGYETLICNSNDHPDTEEECLLRLRSGFVDGIIIASTGQNKRLIRDIEADGRSIVQVVRKQDKKISSVIADYFSCAYESTRYLYLKGCRNIGFIKEPEEIVPFLERYQGYHRALKEYKLPQYIYESDARNPNRFETGYQGTLALLKQNPKIDAIMVGVDLQGLGAIRALKEKGINVPEQVRLISLTGHSIGGMLETSMSSMEMPGEEMGKAATKLLIENIESTLSEKPSLQHIVFDTSLAERETT